MESLIKSLDKVKNKPDNKVVDDEPISLQSLFYKLKSKPGWGDKTAALFVKAIFKIHTEHPNEKIWIDYKPDIGQDDQLFLPVDSVILKIFETLFDNYSWDFYAINSLLNRHWKTKEIVIWDDLWFWGFITQKSNKEGRYLEYNEANLWSLIAIPKESYYLENIKEKANEFLELIQ